MVVQYILATRKVQKEVKVDVTEAKEENEEEAKTETVTKSKGDENKDKDTKPEGDSGTADLPNDDPKTETKLVEVDEYYVKYRNFSYLHCEWKTEEELYKGDKRIAAKLKRFRQKMAHSTNIFENVSFFKFAFKIFKL